MWICRPEIPDRGVDIDIPGFPLEAIIMKNPGKRHSNQKKHTYRTVFASIPRVAVAGVVVKAVVTNEGTHSVTQAIFGINLTPTIWKYSLKILT